MRAVAKCTKPGRGVQYDRGRIYIRMRMMSYMYQMIQIQVSPGLRSRPRQTLMLHCTASVKLTNAPRGVPPSRTRLEPRPESRPEPRPEPRPVRKARCPPCTTRRHLGAQAATSTSLFQFQSTCARAQRSARQTSRPGPFGSGLNRQPRSGFLKHHTIVYYPSKGTVRVQYLLYQRYRYGIPCFHFLHNSHKICHAHLPAPKTMQYFPISFSHLSIAFDSSPAWSHHQLPGTESNPLHGLYPSEYPLRRIIKG